MNCITYSHTQTGKNARIATCIIRPACQHCPSLLNSNPPNLSIPPTHIKTITKLQLLPLPRLRKQTLLSPPPGQPRYPRPQQSTDEEKRRRRYEQRHGQEVHEYEEERQSYDRASGVCVRYPPGYACEEHEEGEEVREGGVGAVPGVFRFCVGGQ